MKPAAPELLAACELASVWLDEVCNPDSELATAEGVVARQQIEAAVAKAKGGE